MTGILKSKTRLLILGGTTEARLLAERLAGDTRFQATVSLAGRTLSPIELPLPVRVGGFAGISGLAQYLKSQRIDVMIDATHPYAANISRNAIDASHIAQVPLIVLERPPWKQQPGDDWHSFATADDAVAALPSEPTTVFSGLGRLSLDALRTAPHHHYVLRVIDDISEPLELPDAVVINARGPFNREDDMRLFKLHRIKVVLAKNAGGSAAVSKIDAARALGIPVHMIQRPRAPASPCCATVDEVMALLIEHHGLSTKRGV
jgi:precorrin-6A/cobalt-precorrin-6A reductase